MKAISQLLAVALGAGASLAATPSTDLFLPSVGHARGACPDGVCSQWRTDAWVFNPPSNPAANVTVSFLVRDVANTSPEVQTIAVDPGEVVELVDVVYELFGKDNAYGALRFASDVAVVVTGRIYDANVQTNKGTGTAGQLYVGLPASIAIGNGESTDLIGVAQDSSDVWRSNFGFVETSGSSATVRVERLDADGNQLAAKSYTVREREARQFNVSDVVGPASANQRLRVSVTSGQGRIVAFASRIDNATGDPSTVEMTTGGGRDGTYLCKLDKSNYDVPVTLTVVNGAISALDTTVLVTSEDVPGCTGGELLSVAGPLPEPVVLDDVGNFSFSVGGTAGGVSTTLQFAGVLSSSGGVAGTGTTTLSGAGSCSGTKSWPMIGARIP
jgi:hypothetical protein